MALFGQGSQNFCPRLPKHPSSQSESVKMSDKAIPAVPQEKTKSSGSYRGLLILSSIQTLLLIGILAALGSIAAKINAENTPMNVRVLQRSGTPFTVVVPTSSPVYVRNPVGTPVSATIVSTVTVRPAFGSTQTVTAAR